MKIFAPIARARRAAFLLPLLVLPISAAAAERPAAPPWDPVAGRKLAVAAVGDCAAGKVEICRQGLLRALELFPLHPEFLQFLASAEERLGNSAAAVEALAAIHRQGHELAFDPPDEWVAKVVAREEYKKVYAEAAPRRATVARGREAFRLPYREMIPESVAYDAKSGDFFVGGVRDRRIVRRAAKSEPAKEQLSDFVPSGRDGLWSVLGMAADAQRRHLWVASTAYPAMQGFDEKLAGSSALFCFDLDSGRLLGRYEGTRPGPKGFNDVKVAPDGAVFVTDHEERPGTLYRLDPKTKKLEPFGDENALGSPEGLAFSSDGRHLFVADYSYGIVRYELATGKHLYLRHPPGANLIGIDHIDFHRGSLIAVQNGNKPHSVLRLQLSPEADRIDGLEVLERALDSYSDPTLGVLVGDELYYVATSNWGRLDEHGQLPAAGEQPLAEPLVLKLPLGN